MHALYLPQIPFYISATNNNYLKSNFYEKAILTILFYLYLTNNSVF